MLSLPSLACVLLALLASALPAPEQLSFAAGSASPFPGHTLLELNDGHVLPSPAFGVGSVWHDDEHRKLLVEAVVSALEVGYRHIGQSNPPAALMLDMPY